MYPTRIPKDRHLRSIKPGIETLDQEPEVTVDGALRQHCKSPQSLPRSCAVNAASSCDAGRAERKLSQSGIRACDGRDGGRAAVESCA